MQKPKWGVGVVTPTLRDKSPFKMPAKTKFIKTSINVVAVKENQPEWDATNTTQVVNSLASCRSKSRTPAKAKEQQ